MPELIHVLDHKVKLLQPDQGFRTSFDSVCLAAACPLKAGQRVVELGSGVGGALLAAAYRVPQAEFWGIEREEIYFNLALQNKELNDFEAHVNFIHMDFQNFDPMSGKAYADHIMMNPPFFEEGHFTTSPNALSSAARDLKDTEIKDWLKAAHRLLKSNGTLTIIFPSFGLDEILSFLHKKFGALEIIPLWSRVGVPAKRVIIRAVKDRKTPLILHAGIIIHEADGTYTHEADMILRDGKAIL